MTRFLANDAAFPYTLDVEVTLLREKDDRVSNVYEVTADGYRFFVETAVDPTGTELVDAVLTGYKAERILVHASQVRDEIDTGVI